MRIRENKNHKRSCQTEGYIYSIYGYHFPLILQFLYAKKGEKHVTANFCMIRKLAG